MKKKPRNHKCPSAFKSRFKVLRSRSLLSKTHSSQNSAKDFQPYSNDKEYFNGVLSPHSFKARPEQKSKRFTPNKAYLERLLRDKRNIFMDLKCFQGNQIDLYQFKQKRLPIFVSPLNVKRPIASLLKNQTQS